MAINNNTNNKIEEDNIIFAAQGAKSFLKCKMDWAGIGKLHVSFVSHTGLENGCKQLGHIEAALPFDGEDGALALGKMILRGDLDKGRARSIKKAKETGAKFPEPVFTYNGGSEAKADRPVMCARREERFRVSGDGSRGREECSRWLPEKGRRGGQAHLGGCQQQKAAGIRLENRSILSGLPCKP